jgi:antitoxin MazE
MIMSSAVKMRIVKMGNSKGVRIPKPILEQLGLGEEVELLVRENQLVIRASKGARPGWDEQFKRMAERGDDRLLDEDAMHLTKWDKDQWQWK